MASRAIARVWDQRRIFVSQRSDRGLRFPLHTPLPLPQVIDVQTPRNRLVRRHNLLCKAFFSRTTRFTSHPSNSSCVSPPSWHYSYTKYSCFFLFLKEVRNLLNEIRTSPDPSGPRTPGTTYCIIRVYDPAAVLLHNNYYLHDANNLLWPPNLFWTCRCTGKQGFAIFYQAKMYGKFGTARGRISISPEVLWPQNLQYTLVLFQHHSTPDDTKRISTGRERRCCPRKIRYREKYIGTSSQQQTTYTTGCISTSRTTHHSNTRKQYLREDQSASSRVVEKNEDQKLLLL